jgi:hypothetical protein
LASPTGGRERLPGSWSCTRRGGSRCCGPSKDRQRPVAPGAGTTRPANRRIRPVPLFLLPLGRSCRAHAVARLACHRRRLLSPASFCARRRTGSLTAGRDQSAWRSSSS